MMRRTSYADLGRDTIVAAISVLIALSGARAWSAGPIEKVYFGLHIHRALEGAAMPSFEFGSWRLWDARVAWPDLEPQKGKWRFDALDRQVSLAAGMGVEVVLPLGLSPTWASARPTEASGYRPGFAAEPASLADWRNYVRTVVTRYKGRVKYFEIWNEPNSRNFFSGTLQSMVDLTCGAYQVIKEVNPNAKVVSPAATNKDAGLDWLEQFLSSGGSKCVDVVGFHFYTLAHESPEAMSPLIKRAHGIMDKWGIGGMPLWNTETGWYVANKNVPVATKWKVISSEAARDYALRALVIAASSGVERFFWYAWDNKNMGLIEPDSTEEKTAALGYKSAMRWLIGATPKGCVERTAVWTCEFQDSLAKRNWIAWAATGAVTWRVPNEWNVATFETEDGELRELPKDHVMRLTGTPIRIMESGPANQKSGANRRQQVAPARLTMTYWCDGERPAPCSREAARSLSAGNK